MNKLKSVEELKKLRESVLSKTSVRVTGENPYRTVISVGMGTCGIAKDARNTLIALVEEITERGLENISVVAAGCMGSCDEEPMVEVRIPGKDTVIYKNVDEALAKEIVEKHIVSGELVEKAIFKKEVKS